MDSLTHLAVGGLTPLAFRNAPRLGLVVLFGIVAGELPDIDAVAGTSARAVLAIHRSFTHSLPAVALFAAVLAISMKLVLRRMNYREKTVRLRDGAVVFNRPADWSLAEIWLAAMLALALHVYLDCMTTFGTQVFWPWSDYRVFAPALFIIDPLFTLPLLGLLLYCLFCLRRSAAAEKSIRWARRGLAWAICYPLFCLALQGGLLLKINQDYAGTEAGAPAGFDKISLAPMPLSPFYWKAIGENGEEYRMCRVSAVDVLAGRAPAFGQAYRRADLVLWRKLEAVLPIFRAYGNFVSFPVLRAVEGSAIFTELTFEDLRYRPTGPEDLTNLAGRGDGMFMMQIRLRAADGALVAWRYLGRGTDNGVAWVELEEPLFLAD